MSEPGFEIAAAFLSVLPNTSDFAAALDEALGGLSLTVGVLPDTSDFASALDDALGGLSLSVVVTPDTSDFASSLDEALGGLSASVTVTPDTTDFAAALDEQLGGLSVTATVTPDAADFAAAFEEQAGNLTAQVSLTPEAAGAADLGDAVNEQAGTISVPVTPVPETADFEAALDEQVGGLTVAVRAVPDAADFQDELNDQVGTPVVGVDVQASVANLAEHIADSLAGAIPIPVVPDVSGFAAAFEEQVDGLTVTAGVVPSAPDFASALDEELGGLSLTAVVTPDASDFAGALDEQAGGLSVPVAVVPNVSGLQEALTERAGTLTVTAEVVPDASGLGAALGGQAGEQGISVPVTADTSGAVEGLQQLTQAEEAAAAAGAVLQGSLPDEALTATGSAAQSAASGLSGLAGEYADLQTQFSGLSSQLDYLDASFGRLSGGAAAASEDSAAIGAQLDSLNASFSAVGDEITAFSSELSGAGGGAAGAAGQLSLLSSMVAELQGNLSAVDDEMNAWSATTASAAAQASAALESSQQQAAALAGEYADLQGEFAGMSSQLDYLDGAFGRLSGGEANASEGNAEMAAQLDSLNAAFAAVGGELGSLGAELTTAGADASESAQQIGLMSNMLTELQEELSAADSEMDIWSATAVSSASQAGASMARLSGSVSDLSEAAPVAADAAEGLSGILGTLTERVSYMAVDPFMWMMAAPLVIDGVTSAVKALADQLTPLGAEVNEAASVVNFSAASWDKLADAQDNAAKSSGSLVSGLLESVADQYRSGAESMVADLGSLQAGYGLTTTQAELLATAAGVLPKTLVDGGSAAVTAMADINSYAEANETGAKAVAQLSTDQDVFSSSAFTATSRVSALDNAFTTLAGNFISVQTAQLNVTGGFDGLEAASEAAGASMKGTNTQSVGLQQSFYAQATAIEQAANAMLQNGDSAQTVTGYINTQITALSKYEGGSNTATTAVQGLKKWEDSLTGSLQTQGSYFSNTLSNDLNNAILQYSGTQTAVNNYASALVDFGQNSPQAKNAQDLLTESIVKGGLAAGQSTNQIATMIAQIEKIPLKEAIQIVLNAEGSYTVSGVTGITDTAAGSTAEQSMASTLAPTGHASGGVVRGGSGLPRADDIPALLSHGEYVVNAGAVSKYGTGFLDDVNAEHFAEGGSVSGTYSGGPGGLGSFLTSNYASTNAMLIQVMENAVAGGVSAAQSSASGSAGAKAPIIVNFNGTQMPTAEQRQAIMTELSALIGIS
jgi:hypothetical protein